MKDLYFFRRKIYKDYHRNNFMHFLQEKTQEELKNLVSDDKFEEMFYNLRKTYLSHNDEHIIDTLTKILSQELNTKKDNERILQYFLKLAYFAREIKNV